MLNNLPKITTKKSKRVGRGYGSGKGGHTSTRGMKGQRSRSGYKAPRRGFEGGQMPLARRIPKLKGLKNARGYFKQKLNSYVFNVADFNEMESGATISPQTFVDMGVIKSTSKPFSIKILGRGELEKKLNFEDLVISESARAKIEAKGGTVKFNN